ncbi:AtpZ/AtpI family protein [Aestuariivirga sp.]|uniref:AtpZ/AtpI family protein n=1 Tax=Aestuariivirga sp. TaxID=2650926 RepID=UPI0025C37A86|nr:AtpZ/AtpI family protein [Aestuariivirga sp.]MCA3554574.1 AtpZ/AtpI family protein [Aestuariivirga sp.]
MTKPYDDRQNSNSSDPELGDLSARLKELSGRIAAERNEQAESAKPSASMTDASAYARGYKLVSEFAAGTLVGGLIGYGIDRLFGTLPFGLIFFLLLGFGAGILNMARAANRAPPAQERLGSTPPPKAAPDDDEED